jgi:hypothetical protein
MRQSFFMPLAHKQVLRIGRYGEWFFFKTEVGTIHRATVVHKVKIRVKAKSYSSQYKQEK